MSNLRMFLLLNPFLTLHLCFQQKTSECELEKHKEKPMRTSESKNKKPEQIVAGITLYVQYAIRAYICGRVLRLFV